MVTVMMNTMIILLMSFRRKDFQMYTNMFLNVGKIQTGTDIIIWQLKLEIVTLPLLSLR